MAAVNKFIGVGRLTRDPERKSFDSGATVTRFSLAVNEKYKNRDGEWVEQPLFVDCQAWNRGNYTLADIVADHCQKGDPLYIDGKLKLDKWEDRDGNKREKMVVVVENVQFLGGKKDDQGGRRESNPEPRRESRRQRGERQRDDGGRERDDDAGSDNVPW